MNFRSTAAHDLCAEQVSLCRCWTPRNPTLDSIILRYERKAFSRALFGSWNVENLPLFYINQEEKSLAVLSVG